MSLYLMPRADSGHDLESPYGYTPTLWICALFIALFGLSTLIHVGQATYYRVWWLFPTAVLAGCGELIGWSARLWSSKNVLLGTPFLMQISTTIIAPTPLVAANFIILGRLIGLLGSQYSRLTPKFYTIVFYRDIIALVVQAYGGATASDSNSVLGGHIMLGGIVFQLVAITVYTLLAIEFLWRYLTNRPVRAVVKDSDGIEMAAAARSKRRNTLHGVLRMMVIGLSLSTVVIFIRSVYRTIELSDGWTGRVIHTQVYFNVLDGAMITIAMFTLNFFHPGRLLRPQNRLAATSSQTTIGIMMN